MGKIAFVFAGQGAQTVGMGKDLYDRSVAARAVFDLAGDEVKSLSFDGPQEKLDITVHTQPCLLAADLAAARALAEAGLKADAAAGFSLGEIAATAYAGILSDHQAFELIRCRAMAMHRAAEENEGCLLAVLKLPAAEVEAICQGLHRAYPANYNCPGQTVVACAAHTAGALTEAVRQAGGRTVGLAVSGAFHSPFMTSAADRVAVFLNGQVFGFPTIPVYANVTAQPYGDPNSLLTEQIVRPVLWQQTIINLIGSGIDTFIELGPGRVLSSLIRKTDPTVRTFQVSDSDSLLSTVQEVQRNA